MNYRKSIFVSYHFGKHESFIQRICHYLRKQGIQTYFHLEAPIPQGIGDWRREIIEALDTSDALLFFHSEELGYTQQQEFDEAKKRDIDIVHIALPGWISGCACSEDVIRTLDYSTPKDGLSDTLARKCALKCVRYLSLAPVLEDDIPDGYPFAYEKDIIRKYLDGHVGTEFDAHGLPEEWPQVTRREIPSDGSDNPVSQDECGSYRDANNTNPRVVVAALSDFAPAELLERNMVFPLAGPRKQVCFNIPSGGKVRVGVLVSGGIAPGTNAVITALCQRHKLYSNHGQYDSEILGYLNGFKGLLSDDWPQNLPEMDLERFLDQGGSLLGTSRLKDFEDEDVVIREKKLKKAIGTLTRDGIRILYIIGGDGSMRAAHVLASRITEERMDLSIVAIPKTMDNDVLWGWQTFGFESAVQRANEIIHQLHVEAQSNPRLCVLQLFGSDSGYVVTHAALASGLCDLFLIPEVPFTMQGVWRYVSKKLKASKPRSQTHGLILVAEAAVPLDAERYLHKKSNKEDICGLTETEKEQVRKHLHGSYWNRPPIDVSKKEAEHVKGYLGYGNSMPHNVDSLSDDEKVFVRKYAWQLRTKGQTPDGLRSAGLKLVSQVLQNFIQTDTRVMRNNFWRDFRVFTNEPRHLIRAVKPTSSDILFGHRLGTLAVDGAMAGYTDFMISQWLTEYVMIPLRLVVLGRKRVPDYGIFYRSAIASTGQPAELI